MLVAAAYLVEPGGIYRTVVNWLVHGSWDFPFLDTHVVLAWIECHRLGVDVFLINPCDIEGRTVAQSPLWLALAWTGIDVSWTNIAGLAQSAAFIGALFLLPRARHGTDAAILAMAYCSPVTAYALERGNTDLTMFVAAVLTARLVVGGGYSWVAAYSIALLAGLLKFYPLAAFAVALREQPGRFLLVATCAVIAVGVFALVYAADLPRIAFQFGDYPFALNFGAPNLIAGLQALAPGWDLARSILVAAMTAPAAIIGIKILRRGRILSDLQHLQPTATAFLLTGSALIVGSFFTTTNRSYRGIFLLLVIHGLLTLHRNARDRIYMLAAGVAVFLLWYNMIGVSIVLSAPDATAVSQMGFVLLWLLGQTAWWWFVAVLLAILMSYVRSFSMRAWTHRQ